MQKFMSEIKKYNGVVVPMMTPFDSRHHVDTEAVVRLVRHVIAGGGSPFIAGTTGESASIPGVEKIKLVESAVQAAEGKSIVYAGISGNSLYDSIEDAKAYHDLGADVFVATMPSYYPVDTDQIQRFFTTLADQLPGPLIIYNIPATTHLSIPLDLVDLLSRHPNVVGFKDSERGMERLQTAVSLWKDRLDFSFLTGWAASSYAAMQLGADGVIPSTGNLAPRLYQIICEAVASGDFDLAEKAQIKADRISELYQKDRILSRGLPVFKAMLAAYGLCQSHMLPPMYQMEPDEEDSVKSLVLSHFGDLNQINGID
jgi:dihydrodipicolinate synthase/N-acetylneuraminate lyase